MIKQPTEEANSKKFSALGIAPKLLEILQRNKFITPTPIQEQSIPAALTGSDIMGIAQTGTGKTLAFGLPMIQRLAQDNSKPDSKKIGLVVLPTRELALQVNETLKKIGGSLGLKTAILIGGENIGRQMAALKKDPHVLIATPGRLIDHMEQKTVNLARTSVLVLDEADRMLDMGFAPQIKKILDQVPKLRQTMLFSATMPHEITKIANSYMRTPIRIEVAPAGSAVNSVTQEIYFVDRGQKLSLLKKLLSDYKETVLVFSRTKYGAKKIARDIRNMNITATEIHSNRSLNQRLEALEGFKKGKYRVLVATDIAARGIDVTGIQLVLNYDLPDQAEDYVHRIGRTGRASMKGHAISFATHDQRRDVNIIEKLIRKALPVATLPVLEKVMSVSPPRPERPPLRGGPGRGGPRGSAPRRGDDPRSSGPRRDAGRSSAPRRDVPRRGESPHRDSSRYSSPAPRSLAPRSSAPRRDASRSGSSSYSSKPSRYGSAGHASTGQSSTRSNSAGKPARGKKKWSDYERGRKPAPQSLKKISQNSRGFFISRKSHLEDE